MRPFFVAPLLLLALVARADDAQITRQRCDELFAQLPQEDLFLKRQHDASVLAWNESYVVDALLDLYIATGDQAYLRELVRRGERTLSHRDDRRGFADASGRVNKRWSIASKYTVAEATLVDEAGRPIIRIRSTPFAFNNLTTVRVERQGAAFSLHVANRHWKREEAFDGLSMDPSSPRYFATVLSHPRPLPKPPAEMSGEHSLLVRAEALGDSHTPPAAQEQTLTPLWHAHVGYVGIIYHPLLKFALLVRDDPALAEFAAVAQQFTAAAEESYADIGRYWRAGPGEDEGFYLGAARGGPAPYDNVGQAFNYIAKQACSELALYQLTGNAVYLDHATRMANLLKNRLEHRADGDLYVWRYWYEPLTTGWTAADDISDHYPYHEPYTVTEDASHATLAIALVVEAARAGVVFDEADVQRFANTFVRNVARDDRRGFNAYVDGSRGDQSYENAAVFGWLPLTEVDPTVYAICREIYFNRGRDDFKSLARLLRYKAHRSPHHQTPLPAADP